MTLRRVCVCVCVCVRARARAWQPTTAELARATITVMMTSLTTGAIRLD
jgi:hypothetical protein